MLDISAPNALLGKEIVIPPLLEFPAYQKAEARLAEAQQELKRVGKRIEAILLELSHPHPPTTQEKALAWLRREDAPTAASGGLREELSKAYDTKRMLIAAVELQRRAVQELGATLSKQIVEQLRPEHVKIVARIAAAVKELAAANQVEREFREALADQGISYSSCIRPFAFFKVGDLKDQYSAATLYLKEVKIYYPEALGLPPEPPQPAEKRSLLRRIKETVSPAEDDWTTTPA